MRERHDRHRLVARTMRLLEEERPVRREVGSLGLHPGRREPEDRPLLERPRGNDLSLRAAQRNELDLEALLLALRHREGFDILLLVAGAAHLEPDLALRHLLDREPPLGAILALGVVLLENTCDPWMARPRPRR